MEISVIVTVRQGSVNVSFWLWTECDRDFQSKAMLILTVFLGIR